MFNSSGKQPMCSLTKQATESGSTVMVMKMKSKWSSRRESAEPCLTKRLGLLLIRLRKPPQHLFVIFFASGTHFDQSLEWRDAGTRYSFQGVVIWGCSLPYQCAVATNDRVFGSSHWPAVPRCHPIGNRNRVVGTCPVRSEAIRSCLHFQGFYQVPITH